MSVLAPMEDLLISIGVVFGAVLIANLLVVPAIASLDRDAGRKLMFGSGFALFGTVAVLALHPPAFLAAVFGYLLIFAVSGGALGWLRLRSIRVMGRVVGAVLLLGVALTVAVALVHMPR